MTEETKIIIVVRGGTVQSVYSSSKDVDIGVLDYDVLKATEDDNEKEALTDLEVEIEELIGVW